MRRRRTAGVITPSNLILFLGESAMAEGFLDCAHAGALPIHTVVMAGFPPPPNPGGIAVVQPPRSPLHKKLNQWQYPVWYYNKTSAMSIWAKLVSLQPDWLISVCYPRKVPAWICRTAARACLNVHSSLLPRYRGPVPLFWQIRDGCDDTGLTVHYMSESIDAGDIVLQKRLTLNRRQSEQETAYEMGGMAVAMIEPLLNSSDLKPGGCPQDESRAGYQGTPVAEDFTVSTSWTVDRIVYFVNATQSRGYPYQFDINGEMHRFRKVCAVTEAPPGELAYINTGKRLIVRCRDGYVAIPLSAAVNA